MTAGGVQHERHPRPGPNDNYMARLGARLVDNGYPVLPIMPGTKKPGLFKGGAWRDYPGWTRHGSRPTSEHELVVWSGWPDAGIGMACGTVVGIDIDIEDARLACDVEQLAGERLGDTPALRIGRAPKRMLVYRARALRRLQAGAARGARARPSVRRLRHPS
jgi:Bifunctional DNA primase/polymerase, N-terminal